MSVPGSEAVIYSLELTELMSDFLKAVWIRDVPSMTRRERDAKNLEARDIRKPFRRFW